MVGICAGTTRLRLDVQKIGLVITLKTPAAGAWECLGATVLTTPAQPRGQAGKPNGEESDRGRLGDICDFEDEVITDTEDIERNARKVPSAGVLQ